VSGRLRAVIDTNVLVAAAIKPTGTCRQLLDAAVDLRWLPVISPQLLDELEAVLRRPKFAPKLNEQTIRDFIANLASVSEMAADPPSPAPHTPTATTTTSWLSPSRQTQTCSYPATSTSQRSPAPTSSSRRPGTS
jgi:putative PIN family toxin of toxin-antitoxin system